MDHPEPSETASAGLAAAPARGIVVPRVVGGESAAEVRLASWQDRILPFLLWMVGLVTLFFLVVTFVQLGSLQRSIQNPPGLDLAPVFAQLDQTYVGDPLLVAQWKTLASLEEHVVERRYHQANVLLMSRTWTRYLGFMTGMILSLVGAAFILGKLREETSSVALKNPAVEANLSTTSPGLVLCVLGTVLMLTTVLTHNEIETRDADPVYTRTLLAPQGAEPAPPRMLPGGVVVDPLTGEPSSRAAAPDTSLPQ